MPEDATAFGLRRDQMRVESLDGTADISDEVQEQRHRLWARAARYAFDEIALPGGYPNILASNEDPERIARSYGRNAERLIKVKRRYDPDNVFRSAIPLPAELAMAGAS